MKKLFLFVAVMGLFIIGGAQQLVRQVIVLNEGPWNGPATIGSYDPQSGIYQNFDTIPARFASDVIIDSGFIYVAADTLLLKYNLLTKQLVAQQTAIGVRELCIWGNQLLVTRAEVANLPSYFLAYDKSNLSFIYELTTLSGRASEVKMLNDTAYVAVNDWGPMGKLAVIDLTNQVLQREVDLGPNGLNPENVEVTNGKVYTVNSMDWTNASVTTYDAVSTNFNNTLLNRPSGCAASVLHLNTVYFQTAGQNRLVEYSITTSSVFDSLAINQGIYGLGADPVNSLLYAGVTDFSTYGKVYLFDLLGALVDSFDVNVSPGTFAYDIVDITSVSFLTTEDFTLFPNPASHDISISTSHAGEYEIVDVTGRVLHAGSFESSFLLDVSDLNSGLYSLRLITTTGLATIRFMKD